jgi:class 3 adenylate cyclase
VKLLTQWFGRLATNYSSDRAEQQHAATLLRGALTSTGFSLFFLTGCVIIEFWLGVYLLSALAFLLLALTALIPLKAPLVLIGNLYIFVRSAVMLVCMWYSGGISSPLLPLAATTPIAALLFVNRRWAWFWVIAVMVVLMQFGWMAINGYQFPIAYNTQYKFYFLFYSLVGLVFICFLLNLVFEGGMRTANHKLEREKEKSDDLLRNILPEEVMQELKATGQTRARSYELVTVLFADFKDFTILSQQMSPEELVTGIDEYFEAFDRIVDAYGVEKIKTVGDAYICASGLPEVNPDNPAIIVQVGLAMLQAVREHRERRKSLGLPPFEIRVGIHSGPLVAGVVGIKKFAYDIWGDTVNTAARMQQHGDTGRVNISGATYELVKDRFPCTHRGLIEAKNKGAIDMYFVEGPNIAKPITLS